MSRKTMQRFRGNDMHENNIRRCMRGGEKVHEHISPLAPFKHETYRTIWLANLSSNFGGLIQAVGAAWMMASISESVNMVALVQASTALPIMLFSLVSGALADNFDRRRVML